MKPYILVYLDSNVINFSIWSSAIIFLAFTSVECMNSVCYMLFKRIMLSHLTWNTLYKLYSWVGWLLVQERSQEKLDISTAILNVNKVLNMKQSHDPALSHDSFCSIGHIIEYTVYGSCIKTNIQIKNVFIDYFILN